MGFEGGDDALKGVPVNEWQDSDLTKFSVGRIRAKRELRSPLAFHILVTQMTLEDWRTGLRSDRQDLMDAVRGCSTARVRSTSFSSTNLYRSANQAWS